MVQYKEYISKNPEEYLERTFNCITGVDIMKLKSYGRRRYLMGECDGFSIFENGEEITMYLGPKFAN